ncbi:MAG: aquaporin [Candidatus Hydrogenedentes bacterium]|nr:aquaporin [Candidatus Hydrogenedentota bacterium]
MRAYLSEALGTFVLVFVGTGAVIANGYSDGAVTLLGISVAFGLVVLAMVYALGDISGAHINPAVTLGLWLAGRVSPAIVLPYIVSQCLGAIAASLLLRIIFGMDYGLGATAPSQSAFQAFAMEGVTTFILMLVILCVTVGAKEKGITAGLVIGAVVTFDIIIAGPISGASMNPARSLGPALAAFNLGSLWLYILAPCLGASAAALVGRALHPAAEDAAEEGAEEEYA